VQNEDNSVCSRDAATSGFHSALCTLHSALISKPAGVSGASIFSYVGAVPPADMSAWKFEGNTSKTAVQVVFPNTTAGGDGVVDGAGGNAERLRRAVRMQNAERREYNANVERPTSNVEVKSCGAMSFCTSMLGVRI
jgi:hypothetical protein